MGSLRLRPWFFVILPCAFSMQALAFVAKPRSAQQKDAGIKSFEQQVVRPSLTASVQSKQFGPRVSQRVDRLSGAVRLLSGDLAVAVDTHQPKQTVLRALVEECHQFVDNNPGVFGDLTPTMLRLDHNALLISKSEQFLKFRVYQNGILVQDAAVDFRFKFGRLVQLSNLSFGEVSIHAPSTKVDTRHALRAFEAPQLQTRVYRIIPGKTSYRAVMVDSYQANLNGEPYSVQVSVSDGQLVEVSPLKHYLSGQAKGQYYKRWYKEPLLENAFSELEITHAEGLTTVSDSNGQFEVTPDFSAFVLGLRGPKVDVKTLTGDLLKRQANTEHLLAVNFEGLDPETAHKNGDIAQAMVFRHVTDMFNYAKKYLDVPWLSQRLKANANLDESCNAYWDTMDQTINFFSASTRCANTGLISDVIFHEWGHGLDANTGGIEDGAFSEGFGDIMSLIMTRSEVLGIGFKLDGTPVRNLEPDVLHPPEDSEVHAAGLIIAGTFWDLYKILRAKHGDDQAIDILSNYAFKSIVTASRYTDVYDALLVIDDNDANLANGTPNLCAINEAFTAHGLATFYTGCLIGDVATFELTDVSGNSNGIIEPGEQFTMRAGLLNMADVSLAGISAEVSVNPEASGVSLAQNQLHWPELASGETALSSDAVGLSLDESVVCGSRFNLRFALKGAEREAMVTKDFLVGRLTGESHTYSAATLPLPIPDNASVSVAIPVAGWGVETAIYKAHLKVDITHPYIGDINVSLVSPSGEVTKVYAGSGGSDDLHLNQDITALLAGKKGLGDWQLKVQDDARMDTGTLDSAALTLTPATFECL